MRVRIIATLVTLVTLAALAFVVRAVATAPWLAPGRRATEAQISACAATVAGDEGEWRRQASQDFPSDAWSQRDAFHGHEAATIRDLARTERIPVEEVIRSVDDDMHQMHAAGAKTDRSAIVVPCKPRPFYD